MCYSLINKSNDTIFLEFNFWNIFKFFAIFRCMVRSSIVCIIICTLFTSLYSQEDVESKYMYFYIKNLFIENLRSFENKETSYDQFVQKKLNIQGWAYQIYSDDTKDETQLWNLEHNYWEYVNLGDKNNIQSFWHPEVNFFRKTIGYDSNVVEVINEKKNATVYNLKFAPIAIDLKEDEAITYLLVYGGTELNCGLGFTITHFWIKENNGDWKLLVSNCNSDEFCHENKYEVLFGF